jgi:small conductance mechanosensitive channel
MEKFNEFLESAPDLIIKYGGQLVLAIVVLIIGFWIVKLIVNAMDRLMEKKNTDASLRPFLKSLMSTLLKVMVVISVMSLVGIPMTSFIAILGAAGLAVGMALSGTLQNFAGGVMLLIFKPFKAGDFIEAQGFMGTVSEIQIFNTILKTPDNKTIIIPNGGLSTGPMTNFSTEPKRRVDFSFGIGYSDDIDKARSVIDGLIKADSRIHADPAPFIAVSELADSSVNFTVRVWADAANYWGIHFDLIENVKKTFDKEGISIPFPQTDVHLFNEK